MTYFRQNKLTSLTTHGVFLKKNLSKNGWIKKNDQYAADIDNNGELNVPESIDLPKGKMKAKASAVVKKVMTKKIGEGLKPNWLNWTNDLM